MPSRGGRGAAGGSKQPLGVCVWGGVPGFGGPKEGGIGEADTFGLSWQPEAGGLYLIPSLES